MTLDEMEAMADYAIANPSKIFLSAKPTVQFCIPTKKLSTFQGLTLKVLGTKDDETTICSVDAAELKQAIGRFRLEFLDVLKKND